MGGYKNDWIKYDQELSHWAICGIGGFIGRFYEWFGHYEEEEGVCACVLWIGLGQNLSLCG
jgi:hypothetical protein